MLKSKEYPDLPWVEPRSWQNANRTSVQVVVVHTTEGSARDGSAENGAAYDARRTDGTSTHYFHDSDSTVQCVETRDIAHTARGEGNRRGIHHELCTKISKADWSDAYHSAMLKRAAKQAARDCKKWGIPVIKLTPAAVKAGQRGICGHADISEAFKQSTHTDPGKNFPWDRFIGMIKAELAPPPAPPKGPAMATDQEDLAAKVKLKPFTDALKGEGSTVGAAVLNHGYPARPDAPERTATWKNLQAMQSDLDSIGDQLKVLTDRPAPDLSARLDRLEEKLEQVLALLQPEPPAEPPSDPS